MSVYIKGMKKPKDRYGCPLFTKEYICMANGIKCVVGSGSGVPKYCPVKELPEHHGRLVDADKLIREFAWCMEQTAKCNQEQWQDVIDRVGRAITVMESEDK